MVSSQKKIQMKPSPVQVILLDIPNYDQFSDIEADIV